METSEKLGEAKYFLEQMRLNLKDRKAFKHNLGAFLSSARSVTFVLQNEHAGNPKFEEWYEKKQTEMKNDKLLDFFIKKRNYVVKEGPAKVRANILIEVRDTITISDSVTIIIKRRDGTEEVVQPKEPERKARKETEEVESEYRWFFEDYPAKDILTLCEEYIKRLTELVEEAERIALP
jgi:hypothetical protein